MSRKQELLRALHGLFPRSTKITRIELGVFLEKHEHFKRWIRNWNGRLPLFDKYDVFYLLSLIKITGEGDLSIERITLWLPLIRYFVADMESLHGAGTKSSFQEYYGPCFARIGAAGNDLEKLCSAYDDLLSRLSWE